VIEFGSVRRIETLAAESGTLQSYLTEIAKFPKLTNEQERELGRRIQQRADDDALGALVEANLRFVVSYARRYRKLGVPFLDLIHEGNLGLLEGARRFDPDRGDTFIAHAAWWVRQSIMHLLSDASGLAALQVQLEQAPAIGERAGAADGIDEHPPAAHLRRAAVDRIAHRLRRERRAELADAAPGLVIREIDDNVMRDALVQQLECAMTELDPQARQVMRLRYGLHGGEALAVPQIAERMRMTRVRVRAAESRATRKLRRGKSLRSYLN
jgi:RNA polymerase primary sigma factor